MPTGIFKRTKEHNKAISNGLKKSGHRPPIYIMEKSSNWKGGRVLRSGYVYIKTINHPFAGKQRYVAEHRLVMEKFLKRYLKPEETIHHIDHIKTNNSIENLQLFSSRGEHTKVCHPEVAKNNSIINKGIRRSVRTEFKKRP